MWDQARNMAFSNANKTGTGAQTDAEIVAAATGKQVKLYRIHFYSSASTTLTIKSGSTTMYGPTQAITSAVLEFAGLAGVAAGNLNYSTSAGNSYIYVEYVQL